MKNRCKILILLLFLVGITPAVMAQYGFGTNKPADCAAVEIKSSTVGFLPPRLSSAELTALTSKSPADGLLVYNTTLKCLVHFVDGSYFPVSTSPVNTLQDGSTLIASHKKVDGSPEDIKITYKVVKIGDAFWTTTNLGLTYRLFG